MLSLASGATPSTFSSSARRSRTSSASFSSKYLSRASGACATPAPGPNATALPDSGCFAFTTTSTRPMSSSAWVRRELVRVSPLVNADEKSTVASMRPVTIRVLCVLRRGMFLTAILREVRSRAASTARITAPAAKMPRRTRVSWFVGMPKSSSIAVPRPVQLVVLDRSVAHPDRPVGAGGDGGVVGDEDKRVSLLPVELHQEVHDLPGGLRVQSTSRLVGPHYGGGVQYRTGAPPPPLLAAP